MPIISVIISVYNAAPYITKAIQSILEQTYTDFELIILNDGSTDNSANIIKRINDRRIIFLDDNTNAGAPARFNQGIEMAKGKYIAHLGADDISLPYRFKYQIELLEKNEDIGICGSDIILFNGKRKLGKWYYPERHEEILVRQFFTVGFAHPAVLIRKNVLKDNNLLYSTNCFPAEDYEMWYRLLKVTRGYNIRKPLVLYRISDTQATATKKELVQNFTDLIRERYLKDLGIEDDDQISYHCSLLNNRWLADSFFFKKAFEWFLHLVEINQEVKFLIKLFLHGI